MKSEQRFNNLSRYIPLFNSLKNYDRGIFSHDLMAGIITAILLIPQGMAYAMLAGLPIEVGLYSSLLPALFYAILGSSRTLSVGPVSIAAIMVASALASPEIQALGNPVENAIILAMQGGIILLVMSVLGMGALVNFISHPVLSGFTTGAAILIIISQVPQFIGVPTINCDLYPNCLSSIIDKINFQTFCIGCASVIGLLFISHLLPKILKQFKTSPSISLALSKSGPLVVIILSIMWIALLDQGQQANVATIGYIPEGLPAINFDFLFTDLQRWLAIFPSAVFISLIAYVESVAIAKVVGNTRNEKVNPQQDLVALGTSNIASAISGGMPVAGGFSRTMVNFAAGARTQIAMIIAVIFVAIALISFTQLFSSIPKTTLAAIILVAIVPLVKLDELFAQWKSDRADGIAHTITLAGVLFWGIEEGIALGVIVTILCYLRRTSRPHIAVVGRIKDTDHFRNIKRHTVETWDKLILFRIDENITFANISYISDFIETESNNKPEADNLVLIFSSVSYIDSTAIELLKSLIQSYQLKGITLHLAEVKGPVMDKLNKTSFLEELHSGKVFFHANQAVTELASVP
jgi:SulP family sulfate permease